MPKSKQRISRRKKSAKNSMARKESLTEKSFKLNKNFKEYFTSKKLKAIGLVDEEE